MLSTLQLYVAGGLLILAASYYTYSQYTIAKHVAAIEKLQVAEQLDTENDKVKDVQHVIDTTKEVYDAKKDVKVDVNTSTGKHSISFN